MERVYAKIQDDVVINTQVINDGDLLDPSFVWIDITDMSPQPFRGCGYDGENFTFPEGYI